MFCIDASVIVSAANPKDSYFIQSKSFLARIRGKDLKVFLPDGKGFW